jgi:hypothetical protein
MSRKTRSSILIVVSLVLASVFFTVLLGCGPTAVQLARTRAAIEFDCPPEDVKVKEIYFDDIYKVWACGHEETYHCTALSQKCRKETGNNDH